MTATIEAPGRAKTLIMGILNVTPDSFCPTGRVMDAAKARAHVKQLTKDGADIVDIGAESSRPGAEPLSAAEELERLAPVLEALAGVDTPLSVDTYHAETAGVALAHGATMINDITALRGDPALADVVAQAECDYVLMHMAGTPQSMQKAPQYNDVVDDISAFFEERLECAASKGIREGHIWLDPGFGFGKTVEHNLTLLRRLHEFKRFGRPILVGTSNKSTIGKILDAEVEDRMEGTAATVALAIQNGADAVRVHDVKSMARVARMTDAVVRNTL